MDLLATRYASPFVLLDEMAKHGRLCEFVREINEIKNEENLWELWLYRVWDKSFEEWKESLTTKTVQAEQFDAVTTVKETFDILSGFTPE